MGDVVQGLGALAALHAARPTWQTVFVTQPEFVPLLHGVPGIAEVIPFGRREGWRGVLALRRALRSRRFDHVLDLQGNWKSAFVARLAPCAARLGMAARWRQEPGSRWLLHRTIEADGVPHPARAALALVQAIAPEAVFAVPKLVAAADEVACERAAVRAAGIDPERPFTVVVVTDPKDPRALRPARVAEFAAVAGPVLQVFGPAEVGLAPPAAGPVLRHARGEVRRLIALGAVVAAAGGRVVGPDQGASHVLAAAGARCSVVFGAQDPRRTAPVAAQALVAPAPPSCSPCRRRTCAHPQGPVCMDFPIAGGAGSATD
jgi:ADP-heptose:LPS heptosyltransferase